MDSIFTPFLETNSPPKKEISFLSPCKEKAFFLLFLSFRKFLQVNSSLPHKHFYIVSPFEKKALVLYFGFVSPFRRIHLGKSSRKFCRSGVPFNRFKTSRRGFHGMGKEKISEKARAFRVIFNAISGRLQLHSFGEFKINWGF